MALKGVTDKMDIRLVVVPSVDNQDEPCNYCDWDTAETGVKANVYFGDRSEPRQYLRCCMRCVVPVVREYAQGTEGVLVEVAA